jgi:sugar/nucleoside kinase (ribokinase family)
MAEYCFRIRFRLPAQLRIEIDDNEWSLVPVGDDPSILLQSVREDQPIKDAEWLILIGKSYEKESDAQQAGRMWQAALQVAFARVGVGADFGARAPNAAFTDAGLRMLEQQSGRTVVNEVHGINVYECEPRPQFAWSRVQFVVGKSADKLHKAIGAAVARVPHLDPVQSLAFDLYSASFFESSADARFLMLMMGLEVLIDPQPRSEDARRLIDELLQLTKVARLSEVEIASLKGTLESLYVESIGAAGRRLATSLEPRTYMGMSPQAFFTACYELRSRLVHGSVPRPPREEVDMTAAHLQTFTGNLLCRDILDSVED